ncbi:hypothetical protein [Geopseudomonas aromaticivorans]
MRTAGAHGEVRASDQPVTGVSDHPEAGEITVEAAVVLALIRVEELVEVFHKSGKTSGEEIVEKL